jgi:Flp pilus assembly protein TadD
MIRGAKFWITMAVFQVVFGLAVVAVTRQYYISDADSFSADAGSDIGMTGQSLPVWPDTVAGSDLAQFGSMTPGESTIKDPAEISRQADEFFVNKQYDRAAGLYERLLVLDPSSVDTYNNLGITLHYLGRSNEALGTLNEGVAVDPTHQRIWLTLGFVNSQLGNVEQARAALTKAAQMGPDSEVGQSARSMLNNLP